MLSIRSSLCVLLLLTFVQYTNPPATAAEVAPTATKLIDFYIPKQSLEQALVEFSIQSGQVVLALPHLIEGQQANFVQGRMTIAQALQQLLQGTGLVVEGNLQKGYVVKAAAKAIPSQDIVVEDDGQALEEVFVWGEKPHLIQVKQSTGAKIELSREALDEFNVDSFAKLARVSPNLNIGPDTHGVMDVHFRGINNYGDVDETLSIAPLYYDDFYISPTAGEGSLFFDIHRIDIFRGAQVGLPGYSASSGAIYVSPQRPVLDESSAQTNLTLGSYNLRKIDAAVNWSINSSLALRIAAVRELRSPYTQAWPNYDGVDPSNPAFDLSFFDQPLTSTEPEHPGLDNLDRSGVRVGLLAALSPVTTVGAAFEIHKDQSQPEAFIDPYIIDHYKRGVVVDANVEQKSTHRLASFAFEHSAQWLDFQYKAMQSRFDFNKTMDWDYGRIATIDQFVLDPLSEQSSSHLLQWSSNHNGATQWQVGIFHHDRRLDRDGVATYLPLPSSAEQGVVSISVTQPELHTNGLNIYTTLGRTWAERFTTRLGLRKSQLKTEQGYILYNRCALESGVRACKTWKNKLQDGDFSRWMYEFATELKIYKTHLASLRYNRTYRPAEIYNSGEGEDEQTDMLEWTLRSDWTTQSFGYEFSVFEIKQKNLLSRAEQSNSEAQSRGAEFMLKYDTQHWGDWYFNGSWLDSHLERFQWAGGSVSEDSIAVLVPGWFASDSVRGAELFNVDGNQAAFAPKSNVSLLYQLPVNLGQHKFKPYLTWYWSEEYYLTPNNRDQIQITDTQGQSYLVKELALQPEFWQLGLGLDYHWPKKGLYLGFKAKNLNNQQIRLAAQEGYEGLGPLPSTYSPPRTFEFELRKRFD